MQASSTVSSMSLQWSVPCPFHWPVTSFTAVVTTSLVVLDSWSWSCLTRCERKRKSAHSLKRTVSPSELTGLLARRVSIFGYERTFVLYLGQCCCPRVLVVVLSRLKTTSGRSWSCEKLTKVLRNKLGKIVGLS